VTLYAFILIFISVVLAVLDSYVYKARDKETNQIIALKRIIFQRDSSGVSHFPPSSFQLFSCQFPLFAIREIKLLKSLQHPNIVSLLNIVSSKGCEDQGSPSDSPLSYPPSR
jgi:serine/threonine protein kinase